MLIYSFRLSIQPPSLRTIDFQRITPSGIEFVRKRGHGLSNLISSKASSILCTFGKYQTGEKVEQWAAEGMCEQVAEEEFDLLKVVPERSIVELVASRLIKEEDGLSIEDVSFTFWQQLFVHLMHTGSHYIIFSTIQDHKPMDAASHYLEVVQKTRQRLLSGELRRDELNKSVMLVKFVPTRMERYIGGPDQVIWDRWEWKRDGNASWSEPTRLLPY